MEKRLQEFALSLNPDKTRLIEPIKLYRQDRVHAAEAGAPRADLVKLSEARDLARRALSMKKQKTRG